MSNQTGETQPGFERPTLQAVSRSVRVVDPGLV
jgi:hypothetical protein